MLELVQQILTEMRSAWRFRWLGVALAWAVFLVGLAWVAWQPNVYEASARVYVDTSSVLRPILDDRIVPIDVATRLNYVRQALLGRVYLERVARENELAVEAVTPIEREAVLGRLLSEIVIYNSVTSRNSPDTIYSIRYRNSRRDTAIGVVSTLLNVLVEDTLGANREDVETAERFLDARIGEYETRLQAAETELANFKRDHADRLPGAEGGYFARIQLETAALEQATNTLRLEESKRTQLQEQLTNGSSVIPVFGGVEVEPPPNSIDARIRDYRLQLDRLLLDYTDKHPDVIAVADALARLEAQRVEQLIALGVTDTNQELSGLESNPIYQAVQMAINAIEVEIASLQTDVATRARRLQELQALMDEVPAIEAELSRLNRDYDVIYGQYQAMVQSRETQSLSRKASDTDQVNFRVIDPPLASFSPVAPDRLRLLITVFIASLMAGGGLCWLRAQLSPVFSNPSTLREVCGVPVLGTVSQVWRERHRVRRRFELFSCSAAIGGLFILLFAAIAIELAGPGLNALVSAV